VDRTRPGHDGGSDAPDPARGMSRRDLSSVSWSVTIDIRFATMKLGSRSRGSIEACALRTRKPLETGGATVGTRGEVCGRGYLFLLDLEGHGGKRIFGMSRVSTYVIF
jgi:hypothetical protein